MRVCVPGLHACSRERGCEWPCLLTVAVHPKYACARACVGGWWRPGLLQCRWGFILRACSRQRPSHPLSLAVGTLAFTGPHGARPHLLQASHLPATQSPMGVVTRAVWAGDAGSGELPRPVGRQDSSSVTGTAWVQAWLSRLDQLCDHRSVTTLLGPLFPHL